VSQGGDESRPLGEGTRDGEHRQLWADVEDPAEGETDLQRADAAEPRLGPVEPGYKNVLRVRLAMTWLPLVFGAIALESLLEDSLFYGLPSTIAPLIALAVVILAPKRIYRHLRYGLSRDYLQVLRGWMFHSDTIVPLVRVQHLDVTRGPFDKFFGTATLVIHTAGTHNSIVTVPGLAPERAEEIRELIREQVRTDFA
jgi:membrane protein YdbS with pleckstrin-like domain